MSKVSVAFVASDSGLWEIKHITTVKGEGLPMARRLDRIENSYTPTIEASAEWILRGITSHVRYVERREKEQLQAVEAPLGRLSATRAALIPIRKSAGWWELPQDERRHIFEDKSKHISTGLKYLPAISRRLYHGYDIGESFDFLTWFEYSPNDSDAFEELVGHIRDSTEWTFVEREVDVRLLK